MDSNYKADLAQRIEKVIDKADLAQELYIEWVMDLDYKADLAQRIEKVMDSKVIHKADLAQSCALRKWLIKRILHRSTAATCSGLHLACFGFANRVAAYLHRVGLMHFFLPDDMDLCTKILELPCNLPESQFCRTIAAWNGSRCRCGHFFARLPWGYIYNQGFLGDIYNLVSPRDIYNQVLFYLCFALSFIFASALYFIFALLYI